jgi:anti-sigma factor RsiW
MANAPSSDDFPPRYDKEVASCGDFAVWILRYVDNELSGQELDDFRSHLGSCANCQAQVEEEKALSQLLHRSRPLYSAPTELKARISAVTERALSPDTPSRLHQPALQPWIGRWASIGQRLPRLRVLAPALLAIALCLVLVPNVVRNVRAANYVEAAVAEHRNHLENRLPIEFHSDSPQLVTAWFAGKVPFDFRLPAAESHLDAKPTYRLTGASVVNYKGGPAALITYETQNDRISLLVDSSDSAVVAGGDEIRSGKLTFHYHNESGFRVITWANHGLSYALVSSVSGPARSSCLVCHQDMADRSNFQSSGLRRGATFSASMSLPNSPVNVVSPTHWQDFWPPQQ